MDDPMAESMTLLNAQIGFLNAHVALVHIPLPLYPLFIHALSSLLLHNDSRDADGNTAHPARPWQHWHPFVNVSITSTECSIVCPRTQADTLFKPILANIDATLRKSVSISKDDYSVIMIAGAGLEAGERVLDLTSPLAMAGISIYFLTSYWSDFIIVPLSARSRVIHALEDRGFVFEAEAGGEAGYMTNPASPLLRPHTQQFVYIFLRLPFAVFAKTFKLLDKHHIAPFVDHTVELVTCAASKPITANSNTGLDEDSLKLGLIKCLTSQPPPKFLSFTLTDNESASLTFDKDLLRHFADHGENLLLGKDSPEQVAITFDLRNLPQESTGIVCGVAGRLIEGMRGRISADLFNMSYLSTAKAGHVIVYVDELDDAVKALHTGRQNGVNGHS